MDMKERMKNGLLFTDECKELTAQRIQAKRFMK